MSNWVRIWEMLYTYGWVLLVLLAAIGALSYFGFIHPEIIRMWFQGLGGAPRG